jgi:hypothetical protein
MGHRLELPRRGPTWLRFRRASASHRDILFRVHNRQEQRGKRAFDPRRTARDGSRGHRTNSRPPSSPFSQAGLSLDTGRVSSPSRADLADVTAPIIRILEACGADCRGCGLPIFRNGGHVLRQVFAIGACGTEGTRTTNSVVRATLASSNNLDDIRSERKLILTTEGSNVL